MSDDFEVPSACTAAVTILSDTSLSPEATASKIVEACAHAVQNPPDNDYLEPGDTPGLWSYLDILWASFFIFAENRPATQDRLVEILGALKAQGTNGCEGWRCSSSCASWGQLSGFGLAAHNALSTYPAPPPPSREHLYLRVVPRQIRRSCSKAATWASTRPRRCASSLGTCLPPARPTGSSARVPERNG